MLLIATSHLPVITVIPRLPSLILSTTTFYFKLPYIGPSSVITQKKVRHFVKRHCNNIDIKIVFSSFKIGDMFSVKDPGGVELSTLFSP